MPTAFSAVELLVSWASYRVGAVCLYAVPLTYVLHLWLHHNHGPHRKGLLLFPLHGGKRHAVFQVFSWAMWGLSAAVTGAIYITLAGRAAAAGLLPSWRPLAALLTLRIPATHLDAASGAAAVGSFIGELFMLKSLLVFEHDGPGGRRRPRRWGRILQVVGPQAASLLVAVMGLALATTGFLLLLALEHMPDTASRILYCSLALLCMLIGASTTHGLGGYLRYAISLPARLADGSGGGAAAGALRTSVSGGGGGDGPSLDGPSLGPSLEDDEDRIAWRFFQPFRGGSAFVATQALGWTLFSISVVCVMLLAKQLAAGVGYCLRSWALSAGALMMAAQLVLGVSVLTFRGRRRACHLLQPMLQPRHVLGRAAGLVLPVFMMYMPCAAVWACLAVALVLLPPAVAASALLALLAPYYVITSRGRPQDTGCRRWEACCRFFSAHVEESLAWWVGARVQVIADFDGTVLDAMAADVSQPGAVFEGPPAPPCSCDSCRQLHSASGEAQHAPPEVAPHEHSTRHHNQNLANNTHGNGDIHASQQAHPPHHNHNHGHGHGDNHHHGRRFVCGFHPHGIYPTGAGMLPLMPSMQRLFPGVRLTTLTASIIFWLPFMRDIAHWAGFRQVVRPTFRRALRDTGGVLLCPGGQAELVYADRAFPPPLQRAAAVPAAAAAPLAPSGGTAADGAAADGGGGDSGSEQAASGEPACMCTHVRGTRAADELLVTPHVRQQLVLFAGHKGFVRLALEEGAWLVPVLAIGETLTLRNLIRAPRMQRATYKRIGFPLPFAVAGRWNVTMLPLRSPLMYVVGKPIPPPAAWAALQQQQQQQREQQGVAGAHPVSAPSPAGQGRAAGSGSYHRGATSAAASGAAAEAAAAAAAAAAGGGVPQSIVDEYHAAFYGEMVRLWAKYHQLHPSFKDAELVVIWGEQHSQQLPAAASAGGGAGVEGQGAAGDEGQGEGGSVPAASQQVTAEDAAPVDGGSGEGAGGEAVGGCGQASGAAAAAGNGVGAVRQRRRC